MTKSILTAPDILLHRGKSGKAQQRSVRRDGWTIRKRVIFLDHLAATCNVSASAQAAGFVESSAYALRRRDPEFADLWRNALEAGYDRLQAMLIERATGAVDVPIGEMPVPDISAMDTELAMRLIENHRRSIAGGPKKSGGRLPGRATKEETNAAIMKKLRALAKRKGISPQ